jgi:outer membrane PBP1 activator LpoA protein
MPRFTAILLLALALHVAPAFAADPAERTTSLAQAAEPLRDVPGSHEIEALPKRDPREAIRVGAGPHVALILPTLSPALGRLADAVRQGFLGAAQVEGPGAPPVNFIAIDDEVREVVEACRRARAAGAVLVVGGLTRDGATTLGRSDCTRDIVLALNEPQSAAMRPGEEPGAGDFPPRLFHVSLSLEHEARQVALLAVAEGARTAAVIGSPSPLARRVQEAFEREWIRAAGELHRVPYAAGPEEASALRDRLARLPVDMVFLALDPADARAVRPYVSGTLPVYATSMSIDPRAEPSVNVDLQGVRYVDMPWFVEPDRPAVATYVTPLGSLPVEQERLHAFGIDAFRLSMLLLRGGPIPSLDGVTGRLSLVPGNAFVRALTPVQVQDGRIVPLKSSQ